MRLYIPLLCAKFQGNRITRSRFIAVFVSVRQEKEKTKKLSQFLKSHISGTREANSLKFGMWSAAVGGNVHSKNRLVSSRKHRATEVRKLRFLSSCQYTHGCYAPASWAARHTTVCLDLSTFLKFTLKSIKITVEPLYYGHFGTQNFWPLFAVI